MGCEYCRANPHHSGCPNEPEQLYEFLCVSCKEPVYEGKEYLDTFKGYICKECIDDMGSLEVLAYLEVGFEICNIE